MSSPVPMLSKCQRSDFARPKTANNGKSSTRATCPNQYPAIPALEIPAYLPVTYHYYQSLN